MARDERPEETRLVLFTPLRQEDRIGTFSHVILKCDDFQATYEKLRGRGVKFSEEPNERPWGIWAQFKDPDDNEFGLIKS